MKVALVHDFLMQLGGAEQILQAFSEMFPDAPIYTIVSDKKVTDKLLPGKKIINSFIQDLPLATRQYKLYLGLMPKAIESFDLSGYDLVISDSSAFAKGIITQKPTVHICYLHTPTRYLWGETDFYLKTAVPKLGLPFVRLLIPYLRRWDRKASTRPDYIIANAQTISDRSKKYYHRSADAVIFPYANIDKFKGQVKRQEYYLMANRLVPYKRNDIVIQAFNQIKLPLKVIGSGYAGEYLKSLNTSPYTKFLGRVNDETLVRSYQECKGYIFPALEDFGITPIEAMAAGTPVIAFGEGGVTESVIDQKTGIFFDKQTPESVINAIKRFEKMSFDSKKIAEHALQFSKERFTNEISTFIKKVMQKETDGN